MEYGTSREARAPGGAGGRARLGLLLLALAAVVTAATLSTRLEPGAPEIPETQKRVLLLTVDTLRADHVSTAPHGPSQTPFLDGLFARGQVFERAVTPIPRTTQALASLLTGAYPHTTGVRGLTDTLAPEIVSVAELFRARGYRTIAVVSNHVLRRKRGLGRGFEIYDYAGDARRAEATTRAALAHVDRLDPRDPVFLWVHYIDPHIPYAPRPDLVSLFDPGYEGPYRDRFGGEPGATGPLAFPADLPKRIAIYRNPLPESVNDHIRKLYAAEVRGTDDSIAELVGGLERDRDPWSVVFTADHGESLGEHDYYWEHGDYVFEGTVRVPLAFAMAEGHPLSTPGHHEDWVSLVDVAPTLIEAFDLPMPDDLSYELEGRSLVPALRGEPLPPRAVFAESDQSYHPEEIVGRVRFDISGRFRAVYRDHWKLIWTPFQTPEREFALYDLAADPGETENRWRPDHPELASLREALMGWVRPSDKAQPAAPDARDVELLRSLGYVE